MDRAVSVCFSLISAVTQDVGEDTGGWGEGDDNHGPHVSAEVVVHPTASVGMRDTVSPATQHGSRHSHCRQRARFTTWT